MRFVSSRNADPQQQRVEQLRRDRAASASLRVAFPTIQQLRLELKFVGNSANAPGSQSHVLHPPARAFFTYPCPYANCDGQFDLSQPVDTALDDPSYRSEGVLECAGMRAQKFDSKHPCQLQLVYTITATRGDKPKPSTYGAEKTRPGEPPRVA